MSKSAHVIFCRWCGAGGAHRFGTDRSGRQRFSCPHCHRTFLRRTRSATSGSRLTDAQWRQAVRLFSLRAGISGADLARFLGVNVKTGQRINRVLRTTITDLKPRKLGGVTEWDESCFSGHWVLGGVSRQERQCLLQVIPSRKERTLVPLVERHTTPDSLICTDEWGGYLGLLNHWTICHDREFVNSWARFVHTNTQEGIWGQYKPLHWHTYRGIPPAKLQAYLAEMMFRYNHPCYETRVSLLAALLSRKINTLLV